MSPVTSRPWLVTAFDYTRFEIVVEATCKADAINQAHRIYWHHDISDERFVPVGTDIRWAAISLVAEVQR